MKLNYKNVCTYFEINSQKFISWRQRTVLASSYYLGIFIKFANNHFLSCPKETQPECINFVGDKRYLHKANIFYVLFFHKALFIKYLPGSKVSATATPCSGLLLTPKLCPKTNSGVNYIISYSFQQQKTKVVGRNVMSYDYDIKFPPQDHQLFQQSSILKAKLKTEIKVLTALNNCRKRTDYLAQSNECNRNERCRYNSSGLIGQRYISR